MISVDEWYGIIDETGKKHFFFQDYLGTVKLEFDESGKVNKKRRYRTFGEEMSGASSGFGFTGREYDEEADQKTDLF